MRGRDTTLLTVTAAAALAAGFLVGRGPSTAAAPPTAGGGGAGVDAPPPPGAPAAKLGDAVETAVATAMEAVSAGDPTGGLFAALGADDPQVFYEFLDRLEAAQLAAMMGELMAGGDGGAGVLDALFEYEAKVMALFEHWVELDPDGAAAFLASPSPPPDRNPESIFDINIDMREVARELALAFLVRRDPGLASDIAGGEADGVKGDMMLWGVALADPARAVALYRELGMSASLDTDVIFEFAGPRAGEALDGVLALPRGGARDEMLAELFGVWGRHDPAGALAGMGRLGAEEDSDGIFRTVLKGYLKVDPEGAAGYVDGLPDERRRGPLLFGFADDWARIDPEGAMSWASARLDPPAFRSLLGEHEEQLSAEVAMRLVGEMEPGDRAVYLGRSAYGDDRHFLQRLARRDPGAAVGWMIENGAIEAARGSGDEFGAITAARDLGTAQMLVEDLPAGAFRAEFVTAVAEEFGRQNPSAALVWASSLAAGDGEAARRAAVRAWAEVEPEGAAQYASEAGELGAVLGTWARGDAEGAYYWAVAEFGGDTGRAMEVVRGSGVIERWSQQDPAGAAGAMLDLPEEVAAAQIGRVLGGWVEEEPLRVSGFINDQLGDGPVRDAAVEALVEGIRVDDLASAVAWAQTIGDDVRRHSMLESLATR